MNPLSRHIQTPESLAARTDLRSVAIAAMLEGVAAIDPDAAEHSFAAGAWAVRIAAAMGESEAVICSAREIAQLHDVGIVALRQAELAALKGASTPAPRLRSRVAAASARALRQLPELADLAHLVSQVHGDGPTAVDVAIASVADAFDGAVRGAASDGRASWRAAVDLVQQMAIKRSELRPVVAGLLSALFGATKSVVPIAGGMAAV